MRKHQNTFPILIAQSRLWTISDLYTMMAPGSVRSSLNKLLRGASKFGYSVNISGITLDRARARVPADLHHIQSIIVNHVTLYQTSAKTMETITCARDWYLYYKSDFPKVVCREKPTPKLRSYCWYCTLLKYFCARKRRSRSPRAKARSLKWLKQENPLL